MTWEQWSTFFLLFVRISALVSVLPFFSWRGIPALPKVGFAGLFAYLLYVAYQPADIALPHHFLLYIFAVGSEALFGLALGFLVVLMLTAARVAGQLIDMESGLAMASVLDPQFGSQVSLYGQFYNVFALVFYLSVNGHHLLFTALARSVSLVPPGAAVFQAHLIPQFMLLFFQMFIIAFQLAAPVVAVLMFSDLALGLLSKTVPQLQVFMVGMPLKAGVALLIIYLIFPYFAQVLELVFSRFQQDMFRIIGLF